MSRGSTPLETKEPLGWPARLADGPVGLRPIRLRDRRAWQEVHQRNVGWLRPWEATLPEGIGDIPPSFGRMVRMLRRQARAGAGLPFVVTYADPSADGVPRLGGRSEGQLVGQLTISGILGGSARWAQIGYWIDEAYAGRGIIPTAVALATDHCFFTLGLHRVEINIRPENAASLRVVEKLGFRSEGLRERYLHIDGAWRDHLSFALTVEEVGEGLLVGWHRSRNGTSDATSS